MKKLLVVWMVLACFTTVKAQEKLSFGPKAGFNLTGISNSEENAKASIHFGGFVEYRLCDLIGLQTELLYSRQGFSGKEEWDKGSTIKVKYRVNYLNIPILARIYVFDNLSVDFGPQLGFALNAKAKSKVNDKVVKEKISDLNTVDLSVAIGASYEFDMGLVLSARYNQGLTNVFDKDAVGSSNKNHVFQLSAGWRFGF